MEHKSRSLTNLLTFTGGIRKTATSLTVGEVTQTALKQKEIKK